MLPEMISLLEQTRVLIDRSTPQDIVEHTVGLVRQHDRYRSQCINLHAAESVSSPTAQRLIQSDLVRRTMIGDPGGPRFHTGAKYYDEIEVLVIELAKKLYGAHYVEWRLLSSSVADGLVVHSLTDVGDTILALERPLGHGTWRETGYAGMRGLKISDIPFDYEDFNVAAGSKVAIMGPSGAGKTTVFNLLTRFYDPQEGEVVVGGVNLVDADPNSIRRHVVMVQQEPVIFSGTIGENIAYGHLDATPSDIMRATNQAELHDFVMTLPVKYETEVGRNGIALSGGQKQRLALSTALLTDPEVLLLDDTTSALDAETEVRIRETLNRVLEGRTSLIITQRIATARDCDKIIVLEDGKLTQVGTHEELKDVDGFYMRILEQQESI